MKHYIVSLMFALILFATPVYASAAPLTSTQVDSIVLLLLAFGVDETTIEQVRLALMPRAVIETERGTIPATAQTPIPQSTPVDPPVPTKIALTVRPNKTWVKGANCEAITFTPEIYDQYGKVMPEQEVMIRTPYSLGIEKTGIPFSYSALSTNSKEAIQFTSGTLKTEWGLTTEDGLLHAKLMNDGSRWYEASSGVLVDKDRLLCR